MGIDIGFANMGVVGIDTAIPAVLGAAVCSTKPPPAKHGLRVADADTLRLRELARFLTTQLLLCRPVIIAAELPSGGSKSYRAARSMALGHGLVVGVLEGLGIPVEWVPPGESKKAVTGDRGASKLGVQDAVLGLFRWDFDWRICTAALFEHVADAAAAVWAIRHSDLLAAHGGWCKND